MHQHAVERALDNGHVWVRMATGRYWKLRRNGQTKTWKTRPDEYRIPVKAGMRAHGYITQASQFGTAADRADFVVTEHDPNMEVAA